MGGIEKLTNARGMNSEFMSSFYQLEQLSMIQDINVVLQCKMEKRLIEYQHGQNIPGKICKVYCLRVFFGILK
jgi:hypothetical protein